MVETTYLRFCFPEVSTRPSRVMDAWGSGRHRFVHCFVSAVVFGGRTDWTQESLQQLEEMSKRDLALWQKGNSAIRRRVSAKMRHSYRPQSILSIDYINIYIYLLLSTLFRVDDLSWNTMAFSPLQIVPQVPEPRHFSSSITALGLCSEWQRALWLWRDAKAVVQATRETDSEFLQMLQTG